VGQEGHYEEWGANLEDWVFEEAYDAEGDDWVFKYREYVVVHWED
jgi:hypothetical protein